jgi:hypothetical protein
MRACRCAEFAEGETKMARPKGVKEKRPRRSPEIVEDMVSGELVRLPSINARKRDFRVRLFRRKLLKATPNLADDKFAPVTLSFCRISILSMDCYRFLHQRGIIGDDGELRRSVDTYSRLINTQVKLAEKLGLSPASYRSVVSDQPFDLIAEVQKARGSSGGEPEDAEVVRPNGKRRKSADAD